MASDTPPTSAAALRVLDEVLAEVWVRTEDDAEERLIQRIRDVIKEMLDAE